jgi:hypothetical protein
MARQAAAQITTDHETIRQWVEERGGYPATVKRTSRGEEPGILRIDYPGYSGEQSLQRISWDKFFEKFDAQDLAFTYQTGSSRFSKLIKRETAASTGGRKGASAAKPTARARATRGTRSTGKGRAATSATARSTTGTRAAKPGRPSEKSRAGARTSNGNGRSGGGRKTATTTGRSGPNGRKSRASSSPRP